MLINSSRTSSRSTSSRSSSSSSNSSSHSNISTATMEILPSTIIWTQTIESITLHININHVRVLLSEQCLKLSNRSKTISLPLFDRVYIDQCDIEQMITTNNNYKSSSNNIIILTLEKECCDFWPHLLMQQADEEIEAHLLEANFLVHIQQQPSSTVSALTSVPNTSAALTLYDTLDFESVINGHGEKTGLE